MNTSVSLNSSNDLLNGTVEHNFSKLLSYIVTKVDDEHHFAYNFPLCVSLCKSLVATVVSEPCFY